MGLVGIFKIFLQLYIFIFQMPFTEFIDDPWDSNPTLSETVVVVETIPMPSG